MRMMDSKGGHRRLLSMLVVLLLSLTPLAFTFFAEGQGGQVGVSNDGPSFVSVSIEEDTDLIYVHVAVRDLNGWDDIYLVNVTVFDEQGTPITQVLYRQYRDPSDLTPAIEWEEIQGENLQRDYSTWSAVPIWPWNPENVDKEIGLNVTFGFTSFSGDRIRIEALDKGLLSCSHDGPF